MFLVNLFLNRKIYRIGLLLILVLFTGVACTGGNSDDPTPDDSDPSATSQPVDPNQQIVLIWWNLFDSEDNVAPLIEAYEAANPNVKIQYDQKGIEGGVESYRNQIDTFLNDGNKLTTPDIFTIHNTWTGAYQNLISPLPSSNIDQTTLDDYYNIIQSDFIKDNNVYSLPLYMDSLGVIFNKDKLIEGGYTVPESEWSSFQSQARALTNRNTSSIFSAGFAGGTYSNTEFGFETLNLLMLQNGVNMLNSEGTQVVFSSQAESADAVSFYDEFSTSSGSWNDKQNVDIAAFLEKELAMFIAPSWRLNDILTYNDIYNIGLNVGVAEVPQLGGGSDIYWPTYWGQSVSVDSGNSAAAWDFIQFISQKDQLRTLNSTVLENGRKVGLIYPYRSMEADIVDNNLVTYAQMLRDARNWDMYDGYKAKQIFIDNLEGTSGVSSLETIQKELNDLRTPTDIVQ